MKKLLSLLLIICSIGVAYADDKSTVTSLKYVTDELNTRQDKFGANDGKAMTFTNVAGGNLPRDVKASLGTSTSDTGLPTVSAVNTGLENKQDEIGAANTNTVVTYTGTPGTLGQKGIYQDTGTYAAQQNNLIQASTFNAALRNGLENEFVCADRDPVSNQCWLWTIHNDGERANLFNTNGATINKYYDSVGIEQSSNSLAHTDYIVAQPNTIYTWSVICKLIGSVRRVVQWDENKNFITGTHIIGCRNADDDGKQKSITFTTEATTKYLTLNYAYTREEDPRLEQGYITPQHSYTTILPTGYTPVEYIESTGTQYIDTGFSPLPDDDLSVEFEFYSNQIASGKNICGVGVGEWSTGKGWQIGFAGTAGGNSWNQKRVSDVVFSQMGISARVWYKIKVNSTGYFVNNVLKKQISAIEAYTTDLGNFYIFRANNKSNGSINFNDFSGRIGIFSLFKNAVLVFNGIPAKHGNVVGMYDTVSGTFKENAGTGTFTAGPDVSNIVYIPQDQN